jgi:hypothetical protein
VHWLTPVVRGVKGLLHAQLPDLLVKHQGLCFFKRQLPLRRLRLQLHLLLLLLLPHQTLLLLLGRWQQWQALLLLLLLLLAVVVLLLLPMVVVIMLLLLLLSLLRWRLRPWDQQWRRLVAAVVPGRL